MTFIKFIITFILGIITSSGLSIFFTCIFFGIPECQKRITTIENEQECIAVHKLRKKYVISCVIWGIIISILVCFNYFVLNEMFISYLICIGISILPNLNKFGNNSMNIQDFEHSLNCNYKDDNNENIECDNSFEFEVNKKIYIPDESIIIKDTTKNVDKKTLASVLNDINNIFKIDGVMSKAEQFNNLIQKEVFLLDILKRMVEIEKEIMQVDKMQLSLIEDVNTMLHSEFNTAKELDEIYLKIIEIINYNSDTIKYLSKDEFDHILVLSQELSNKIILANKT